MTLSMALYFASGFVIGLYFPDFFMYIVHKVDDSDD